MSAIPAAKLALLALLQARPGLAGVHVAAGLPAEVPAQLERIYVDAALLEAVSGEDHPSQETFTIQVVIETRRLSGRDPAGYALTEARKWVLYEELLAVDPQLGVAVWGSTVTVLGEATRPTPDGWFGQVLAGVHCRNVS